MLMVERVSLPGKRVGKEENGYDGGQYVREER
jgi:hypothetical protein